MECTLVVRSRSSIRQWKVDEWTALTTIAALSAEPETEKELMWAIERYGIEHRLKHRGQKLSVVPPTPDDGSWCFIDLVARAVICAGDWELPPHRGALEKDDFDPAGGSDVIWLAVPRHFMIERTRGDW